MFSWVGGHGPQPSKTLQTISKATGYTQQPDGKFYC